MIKKTLRACWEKTQKEFARKSQCNRNNRRELNGIARVPGRETIGLRLFLKSSVDLRALCLLMKDDFSRFRKDEIIKRANRIACVRLMSSRRIEEILFYDRERLPSDRNPMTNRHSFLCGKTRMADEGGKERISHALNESRRNVVVKFLGNDRYSVIPRPR